MANIIKSALVGHTGFVGSTLKNQHNFDAFFRSTDISTIANQEFDFVVCAGAPAKKWLANQRPDEDYKCIQRLIRALSNMHCKRFVLISTVDVFSDPNGVDESSIINTTGLCPYGLHRRQLELFVEKQFKTSLVLRLPGLVGPGLRKNIIYDIHNNYDVATIDSRNIFQFYPMVNLWSDLQKALTLGIGYLHLTSEPLSVSEVSLEGFGIPFDNPILENPINYNLQTIYALQMGGEGRYTYSKRESMLAVRAYAQSEPNTVLH
jgi:hypothetical protein